MQVIIDIPSWLYNAIMECKEPPYSKSLGDAVREGTLLSKGHGRLVDEKDLSLMTVHLIDGMLVCDAPTIVEAEDKKDKEVEEELCI